MTIEIENPNTGETVKVPEKEQFGEKTIHFDRIYLWSGNSIVAEKVTENECFELVIEENGKSRKYHLTTFSDIDPAIQTLWNR